MEIRGFQSYTQHRIRRKPLYFVYGGYWWDGGSWLNDDARVKVKWKTSNSSLETFAKSTGTYYVQKEELFGVSASCPNRFTMFINLNTDSYPLDLLWSIRSSVLYMDCERIDTSSTVYYGVQRLRMKWCWDYGDSRFSNLIRSTEFVENLYTLLMVDIDEMVVRGWMMMHVWKSNERRVTALLRRSRKVQGHMQEELFGISASCPNRFPRPCIPQYLLGNKSNQKYSEILPWHATFYCGVRGSFRAWSNNAVPYLSPPPDLTATGCIQCKNAIST